MACGFEGFVKSQTGFAIAVAAVLIRTVEAEPCQNFS